MMMKVLVKMVYGLQPLTVFAGSSMRMFNRVLNTLLFNWLTSNYIHIDFFHQVFFKLRSQSTLSSIIKICQKTWQCYYSYTYFRNIPLNVPTFLNIFNLPFLLSPNIGKIGVKVGPKTSYFFYVLNSCLNRIAVFKNFFSLM